MENNSKPHERGTIREERKEEGHTLIDVRMMNAVVIGPTKRTLEPPNSRSNHQRITAPSPCQNVGKRPPVLSCQHHRGGSNENPTAVHHDLKSINVEAGQKITGCIMPHNLSTNAQEKNTNSYTIQVSYKPT